MIGNEVHFLKDQVELGESYQEFMISLAGEDLIRRINFERDPIKVEQANTEFDLIRLKGKFEGLKAVLNYIDGKIDSGRKARRKLEEANGS